MLSRPAGRAAVVPPDIFVTAVAAFMVSIAYGGCKPNCRAKTAYGASVLS